VGVEEEWEYRRDTASWGGGMFSGNVERKGGSPIRFAVIILRRYYGALRY